MNNNTLKPQKSVPQRTKPKKRIVKSTSTPVNLTARNSKDEKVVQQELPRQRSNTLKVPPSEVEPLVRPTVRYSPSVDSFTRQAPKVDSSLRNSKSTGAISMFQKIFQNNNIARHKEAKQSNKKHPPNVKIVDKIKENMVEDKNASDNFSKTKSESERTQFNQDIYKLPKGPPPPYNKQLRHHSLDYSSKQHSKQQAPSRRFGSCDSVGSSQLTSQENMAAIHDIYDMWPGRGYDTCASRDLDSNQSRDYDTCPPRDYTSKQSRDSDTCPSRDHTHKQESAQLGLLNIQNLARMELENTPNRLGIYNATSPISPQSTETPIQEDLSIGDLKTSADIWPSVSSSSLSDTLCYPQKPANLQQSQIGPVVIDQSGNSVHVKTDPEIEIIIDDGREVLPRTEGVATINSHAMSYLSTDV